MLPLTLEGCSKLKFTSSFKPSPSLDDFVYILSTTAQLPLISSSLPVRYTTLLEPIQNLRASWHHLFLRVDQAILNRCPKSFRPWTPSCTNMECHNLAASHLCISFQVTTANIHPVSVTGLAAIQKCLGPEVPELKVLRPTTSAKWIILFIVPEPMSASFVKQGFKDGAKCRHWEMKTTQYILGLPEREVLISNCNSYPCFFVFCEGSICTKVMKILSGLHFDGKLPKCLCSTQICH